MSDKYRAAYERQKKARERAEQLLEERSRELYDSNQALKKAYDQLKDQKNQIFHQEKLATIGLLSAGVAHEVNNPAGFIRSNMSTQKNYIQSLLDYIRDLNQEYDKSASNEQITIREQLYKHHDIDFISEDMTSLIDESLDGIQRIERIVRSLRDFSRPDAVENLTFDLNECITSTLNLLKTKTKYKADVELELGDVPLLCGQPGSIGQVVLNFVVNACDAIEDFGKIVIRSYQHGEFGVFEVADNGSGIEEDALNSIFDPFFTTKEIGKGTGLGLSVSHGIIKNHGGVIEVSSKVGQGTKFKVFIPIGQCEVS